MEYCDKCGWIKPQCQCEKPMTNADRIRNMSDEELENFLKKVRFCPPSMACSISAYNCSRCRMNWLQTEVKE